ncbi:hypothetical protein RRG08_016358, partial [Elysia crispata]
HGQLSRDGAIYINYRSRPCLLSAPAGLIKETRSTCLRGADCIFASSTSWIKRSPWKHLNDPQLAIIISDPNPLQILSTFRAFSVEPKMLAPPRLKVVRPFARARVVYRVECLPDEQQDLVAAGSKPMQVFGKFRRRKRC